MGILTLYFSHTAVYLYFEVGKKTHSNNSLTVLTALMDNRTVSL